MKTLIIGLGAQGRKRLAAAGSEVTATVDPVVAGASYRAVEDVPLDRFDAALVCTPDHVKVELLGYLLSRGKHVLVEKPLLAEDPGQLRELAELARGAGVTCYTAYNHRFEPMVVRLKELVDATALGPLYLARLCYGNGTARNVRESPWRDQGLGVWSDLGSHLLDLAVFLFGRVPGRFELWSARRFENRAFDHVVVGLRGTPTLILEASLVSWRNAFTIEVVGERGSARVDGLRKWGASTLTHQRRVFPSGQPVESVERSEGPDSTWALDYEHFKRCCERRATTLEHDRWLNDVLHEVAQAGATVTV